MNIRNESEEVTTMTKGLSIVTLILSAVIAAAAIATAVTSIVGIRSSKFLD